MHRDLEKVLFSKEQIDQRVEELAQQITKDYQGKDLVLISILKGGIIFLADLTRRISIKHSFDVVGATSYGQSHFSSGQVIISKDVDINISDRDVLLIEDIYDTGRTLKVVRDLILLHSPRSLEICTFLYKEKRHQFELPVKYIGFSIPNVFVVGYGLDYREKYRHLNYIGVLKKEVYY